jgi:tetratricopeptide (TPR) repeat protein
MLRAALQSVIGVRKAASPNPGRWRRTFRAVGISLVLVLLLGTGFFAFPYYQRYLARRALDEDAFQEALDHIDWCLWFWPRCVESHLAAARINRYLGNYAAVEEHLNRCTELCQGATEEIQLEWVFLRAQGGDFQEVEDGLWRCVLQKNHPHEALILETLAAQYIRTARYQAAAACLTRWLEIDPENIRARDWRGLALERMDQVEPAIEDYERVLDRAPGRWKVRLRLADIFLMKSHPQKARQHLEYLLRTRPEQTEVLVGLGRLEFLEGNLDEAARLLDAALRENPNHLVALLHRGKVEYSKERPAEAEGWLRRGKELAPTHVEINYNLYLALQHQPGREKEAALQLAYYQEMNRLNERLRALLDRPHVEKAIYNPDYTHEVGELCLKLGNERLGLYWLNLTLKYSPDHAPTHSVLARYYEENKAPDLARMHRLKAAK